LRASRRRGARAHAGLLVALRGPARPLRRSLRRQVVDRPAVRTLDDLKAAAREARERGFKALKTNVLLFDAKGGRQFAPGMVGAGIGHPELNLDNDVLDALIAQLTALREGAGDGVRLLLDLNFNYKPEGLRRIAKAVEPFDLMWLEMDM